jgi:hypothetical protein
VKPAFRLFGNPVCVDPDSPDKSCSVAALSMLLNNSERNEIICMVGFLNPRTNHDKNNIAKRPTIWIFSKITAPWGVSQKDSGGAPQLKGARFFSFEELKNGTNNFSDEIGSGGYGKVSNNSGLLFSLKLKRIIRTAKPLDQNPIVVILIR